MAKTETNEIEMLTREEVATILRVDKRTVDSRVNKNQIPAYRLGSSIRFKKSEVIQYIDQNRNIKDANQAE